MNFEQAAESVKTLSETPSDAILLELYGLYKQATIGNINIPRPSFWDLTGKAKWDSWKLNENMSSSVAKNNYIALVIKLMK